MLHWLLDKSMGLPGPNGHWPPWLTVLFHTSNFITAMALMFVPLTVLGMLRRKRRGVTPRDWLVLLWMFPALAMSRLMRFCEIYGPPYNLTTIIDTGSAVTSVWAVASLPRIAEHLALLPSREDVHELREALNGARMQVVAERMSMEMSYDRLRKRIDTLEVLMDHEDWAEHVRKGLVEMRAILDAINAEAGDA